MHSLIDVNDTNPIPVYIPEPRQNIVTSRTDVYETEVITVPGITAADALDAGDTFGSLFEIRNVAREPGGSALLLTATFYDKDDEGIAKTLHLFRQKDVTLAASDAAWALAKLDAQKILNGSPLIFSSFTDHVNCQHCTISPTLYVKCNPGTTSLWGAFQTSGADNIAADAMPAVRFVFARD